MPIVNRIGTFLILLGLLLIGLFILSDVADAPACNLLAMGGILVTVGIIMWFRDPVQPGPPPERFRLLRSLSNKKKPEKK